MPETGSPQRLAKRIAASGLCSRREAERWIAAGRVDVNQQTVSTPAFNVTADDVVAVDGKIITAAPRSRIWMYHKPTGQVTTHKDPHGRPTVFESLPRKMPRVISVGRLDLNSEGLLLLTNDGELARSLELPSSGWRRTYRVRVHGAVNEPMLAAMREGLHTGGVQYAPAEVALDSSKGRNHWLTVTLTEGKNREIRKLFAHFDCQVTRLIRTAYGPYTLGDLPKGEVQETDIRA